MDEDDFDIYGYSEPLTSEVNAMKDASYTTDTSSLTSSKPQETEAEIFASKPSKPMDISSTIVHSATDDMNDVEANAISDLSAEEVRASFRITHIEANDSESLTPTANTQNQQLDLSQTDTDILTKHISNTSPPSSTSNTYTFLSEEQLQQSHQQHLTLQRHDGSADSMKLLQYMRVLYIENLTWVLLLSLDLSLLLIFC